ncbi:hypothetical protein M422DRAFT_49469 [Sphaerobolus stellatus SS14]|uniref:Uncharacterized protein n=1 Tax=Sphaerobolus stellatus (strain SS14) TaxID=990650 RepID=A0A0C9UA37_SPHS4|nr:hypothetical protein M422DRAFT_49469 [Sphaerobolus stellatus SS14]
MPIIVHHLPLPYDILYEMVFELVIEYLESQFIVKDLLTHDWNPVAALSASTSEFQVVVMDVACQVFSISPYDISFANNPTRDDLMDIINELCHPHLVPPSWSLSLLSIVELFNFRIISVPLPMTAHGTH